VEGYASAAKLEMNPNRSPQCIKIPLATSPDHYASLGHARAIIYSGAYGTGVGASATEQLIRPPE
jgi:hypothetical protein